MLPLLSKSGMYRFCYPRNGSDCRPSASNQRADSTVFLRVKRKVRIRRFELPRDYLPLGPQPSASASSAISAETEKLVYEVLCHLVKPLGRLLLPVIFRQASMTLVFSELIESGSDQGIMLRFQAFTITSTSSSIACFLAGQLSLDF